MIFLNGFKVSSTNSLIYSISLTAQLLPSDTPETLYQFHLLIIRQQIIHQKTLLSSYSLFIGQRIKISQGLCRLYILVPTYVQAISFTVYLQLSQNDGDQFDRQIRVYSQCISGSDSFQYHRNKHRMRPFNTFLGLTSFLVSNQNLLSLESSIVDQNTFSVFSPNYLSVNYAIVYSKWCSNDQLPFYRTCCQSCPSCTYQSGDSCYLDESRYSLSECWKEISADLLQLKLENVSKYDTFIYSLTAFVLFSFLVYALFTKLKAKFNNDQLESKKKNEESEENTPANLKRQLEPTAQQFSVKA